MNATAHMDCPGCGTALSVNVDYPEPAPPYDPEYFTVEQNAPVDASGNAIVAIPVLVGEQWLIQRIFVRNTTTATVAADIFVGRGFTTITDIVASAQRDSITAGNKGSADYPHFLYARSHDIVSAVWTGGTANVGAAMMHIQYRLWRTGG